MRRYFKLFKKRLQYFLEKSHQVFICMIDYKGEPCVNFGLADLNEPYEREKELRRGIYVRKLKDGKSVYVTHEKGKYCLLGCNLLSEEERMIVAYSPNKWSLISRDEILIELFIRASIGIRAAKEIMEDEYEKGKVTLDQLNERIRKTNVAQFELNKLIDKYCYTEI